MAGLEDSHFRNSLTAEKKTELLPELKLILKECVEDFSCKNWIISLALVAWYFKEKPFLENLIKIINLNTIKVSKEDRILFKLFQGFAVHNKIILENDLLKDESVSIRTVCMEWILLNKLNMADIQ